MLEFFGVIVGELTRLERTLFLAMKNIKGRQACLRRQGFTLFETILVLSIFSLIGVMITGILASSIRSVKKSQNLIKVKNATSRMVDLIERQIRSGKLVSCPDSSKVQFTDEYGNVTSFDWDGTSNMASGSATPVNLNPTDVQITSAVFACTPDVVTGRTVVDFTVTAQSTGVETAESATADFVTKIIPRNK